MGRLRKNTNVPPDEGGVPETAKSLDNREKAFSAGPCLAENAFYCGNTKFSIDYLGKCDIVIMYDYVNTEVRNIRSLK